MLKMDPRAFQGPAGDPAVLDRLEQALSEHPQDPDALEQYSRQAVVHHRIDAAKHTIAQLQDRFPWDHQLRRTFIALCLQQKDYAAAMQAVEKLVAFSKPDDALIDAALAVRRHLGPRTIPDRLPTASPPLSLCLIVRDEQALLGACLNAVKALVDEIIVVDTGSIDRSADIARIYGARVYDFKWCDDFSEARNASLDKARGDWILILDADEIIAPRDHGAISRIVARNAAKACAYSLQTRNYTNLANGTDWHANDRSYPRQETGLGWFPSNKVRLFPRSAEIRFRYPVHELVDPSLRAAGVPIVSCPIPIHHYGHVNEAKNARKARRYFELGYAKLEQLGQDQAALRELAVQAGQLERWTEAIALWHRYLETFPDRGEAYANIAGACWQTGSYEQGIVYSRKAIAADPEMKEGHYNLAVNLLMTGQPQEAAAVLQDIVRTHRHYLAAGFMLAAALSVMGDPEQGRSLFAELGKTVPATVLAMAVQDLAKKFSQSGLSGYADLLGRGFQC
jgi:glycosyltransferase involved in cell wall biosynthesis